MAAPTATINKVRYRLIDVAPSNPNWVTATTLQAAIDEALVKYTRDRPLEVVEDQVGDGTPFMVVVGTGAVLTNWVDGFSQVLLAEYPAEAVSVSYVPRFLEQGEDFEVGYRAGEKQYIRFRTVTPTASETVRFTYTSRHTHTDATDTVYPQDVEALCDLAAYYACLQMATKMAGSNSPVIQADSVNYRDGQLRYSQMAKEWLTAYNDKMGIQSGTGGQGAATSVRGASARGDWDQELQSGYPFITHGARRR